MRKTEVVEYHLRRYGRAPFLHGSTQGFPSDDSDEEWEDAFGREFGRQGMCDEQKPPELNADVNIIEVVQYAFHVYDGLPEGGDEPGGGVPPHAEDDMPDLEMDGSATRNAGTGAEEVDGDLRVPPLVSQNLPNSTTQAVLKDSAPTPLYAGAQLSSLSATGQILQIGATVIVTTAFSESFSGVLLKWNCPYNCTK